MFFEGPAEIVDIVEAGSGGDFGNGKLCMAQHVIRPVQPDGVDVFRDRMSGQLLEESAEMEAA
ncbi:hypothetical protein D3C85_1784080 [compost metagenome]